MTNKKNIKKTTIELSQEHYIFLKEKALDLQKQNKTATVVSIIRNLIEEDWQKWLKKKERSER